MFWILWVWNIRGLMKVQHSRFKMGGAIQQTDTKQSKSCHSYVRVGGRVGRVLKGSGRNQRSFIHGTSLRLKSALTLASSVRKRKIQTSEYKFFLHQHSEHRTAWSFHFWAFDSWFSIHIGSQCYWCDSLHFKTIIYISDTWHCLGEGNKLPIFSQD